MLFLVEFEGEAVGGGEEGVESHRAVMEWPCTQAFVEVEALVDEQRVDPFERRPVSAMRLRIGYAGHPSEFGFETKGCANTKTGFEERSQVLGDGAKFFAALQEDRLVGDGDGAGARVAARIGVQVESVEIDARLD